MEHEQKLRAGQLDADAEFDRRRREIELEVGREREINAEKAAFMERMKGCEVDLTRYLVAQYQHPDRLIRIDGGGAPAAQMHVHEE